ncbi:DUF1819 family protein [Phormidium tenue FACHB-886]|nr:DUF1819 family protein [Phormidium tenue FACHB-886]
MLNLAYAAHTRYAFALTETVAIAELLFQGLDRETIKQMVVQDDLLQMRSQTSRQGAFQTIWKRLEKLSPDYIKLIATGNADVRRFTILFSILLEHRLLRELIIEVLLDKLKQFDLVIKSSDLRIFFEAKREESQILAKWSDATYKKAAKTRFRSRSKKSTQRIG